MNLADHSCKDDKTLVVILHGYLASPTEMRHVAKAAKEVVSNAYVFVPVLALSRFSTVEPIHIARKVLQDMDSEIAYRAGEQWEPFQEIILIGHSCGAVLARKVYLLAGPESREARFEDSYVDSSLSAGRPWFGLVKRIVLLAGMNRGWSLDHHLGLRRAIELQIGIYIGNLKVLLSGRQYTIFHLRKGAPFITELRLQWLALHSTKQMPAGTQATTVQLLGTIDDLVSPTDNIDLDTGGNFVYLDIPFSGHSDVIEMDESYYGGLRREIFQEAIAGNPVNLSQRNLVPQDLALAESRGQVSDVIFVIHGIRDVGYWTQKIARRVEALGNAPPKIYESETSSYGYFAMIPFLLPSRRREKVQWLMDQYVKAKSLYPNARFSYVGHSNGTYLLASALAQYRGCRFQRVVFAGSVVRTDFNWAEAVKRGQTEAILNYVATSDAVVAWFPGALEILNWQDLGSAGHNGFRKEIPELFQVKYVSGGHGAALSESNWDYIARFVVAKRPEPPPEDLFNKNPQNRFIKLVGTVAPVVWIGLALLVWGIGYLLFCLATFGGPIAQTLILVAYVWLIWKVLTRV